MESLDNVFGVILLHVRNNLAHRICVSWACQVCPLPGFGIGNGCSFAHHASTRPFSDNSSLLPSRHPLLSLSTGFGRSCANLPLDPE